MVSFFMHVNFIEVLHCACSSAHGVIQLWQRNVLDNYNSFSTIRSVAQSIFPVEFLNLAIATVPRSEQRKILVKFTRTFRKQIANSNTRQFRRT